MSTKRMYSATVYKSWIVLLILVPIVLWVLPSDIFDGEGFIVCPSRLFFNFECFGCGSTRAIMHLHHWELEEAVYYNAYSPILYPLLVLIWAIWLKSALRIVGYIPDTKHTSA